MFSLFNYRTIKQPQKKEVKLDNPTNLRLVCFDYIKYKQKDNIDPRVCKNINRFYNTVNDTYDRYYYDAISFVIKIKSNNYVFLIFGIIRSNTYVTIKSKYGTKQVYSRLKDKSIYYSNEKITFNDICFYELLNRSLTLNNVKYFLADHEINKIDKSIPHSNIRELGRLAMIDSIRLYKARLECFSEVEALKSHIPYNVIKWTISNIVTREKITDANRLKNLLTCGKAFYDYSNAYKTGLTNTEYHFTLFVNDIMHYAVFKGHRYNDYDNFLGFNDCHEEDELKWLEINDYKLPIIEEKNLIYILQSLQNNSTISKQVITLLEFVTPVGKNNCNPPNRRYHDIQNTCKRLSA